MLKSRLRVLLVPGDAHAPNGYYLVEPARGVPIAALAEVEKAYVDLLYALSGQ